MSGRTVPAKRSWGRADMHVPDHDRTSRIGMPEAVLCSPKSDGQLAAILVDHVERGAPTLFTRLAVDRLDAVLAGASVDASAIDHDAISSTAIVGGTLTARPGRVAIVAAGTSDQAVAAEAARTLTFSGIDATQYVDVGVAGLWRLEARIDEIRHADVVIVVAGMDAALVSVLGGLVANPIIAVPTSVGYGVAAGGSTALHSALATCAQGVAVMNVDNGFGAACAAIRILNLVEAS